MNWRRFFRLNRLRRPRVGRIDDLTVWNEALTDVEVKDLADGRDPLTVRPHALTTITVQGNVHEMDATGKQAFAKLIREELQRKRGGEPRGPETVH